MSAEAEAWNRNTRRRCCTPQPRACAAGCRLKGCSGWMRGAPQPWSARQSTCTASVGALSARGGASAPQKGRACSMWSLKLRPNCSVWSSAGLGAGEACSGGSGASGGGGAARSARAVAPCVYRSGCATRRAPSAARSGPRRGSCRRERQRAAAARAAMARQPRAQPAWRCRPAMAGVLRSAARTCNCVTAAAACEARSAAQPARRAARRAANIRCAALCTLASRQPAFCCPAGACAQGRAEAEARRSVAHLHSSDRCGAHNRPCCLLLPLSCCAPTWQEGAPGRLRCSLCACLHVPGPRQTMPKHCQPLLRALSRRLQ